MSFADNLACLRQHHTITQEALAEKLNVSRQTVSKWEAGINFPETDKLLILCDMFHVSLDDLMRGDVTIIDEQDTLLYNKQMSSFNKGIVIVILAGTLGLVSTIVLSGLGFPENIGGAIMLTFFLIAALVAVVCALNLRRFKHKYPQIVPQYGKDELERFSRRFPIFIATGIGIAVLGVIIFVALTPEDSDTVLLLGAAVSSEVLSSVLMLLLGIGGSFCAWAGLQRNKYLRDRNSSSAGISSNEKYLAKATPAQLRRNHIVNSISGIIMIVATIAFLVFGFFGGALLEGTSAGTFLSGHRVGSSGAGWAYSWLAFPVGGLLCGIASLIVDLVLKDEEQLIAEAQAEDPWCRSDETDGEPEEMP